MTVSNDNQRFTVRALGQTDASAFRAVRLHAVIAEGDKLGVSYESEIRLSYEDWERRITPTEDICYFGLFDKDNLIGFMRAIAWDEDSSGATALWGAAYLCSEYRGQRIAEPLYLAREQWTRNHPRYTNAVMFIKHDNDRSRAIHLKHGAQFMFSRDKNLPGRPTERWDWYRVALKQQHIVAA